MARRAEPTSASGGSGGGAADGSGGGLRLLVFLSPPRLLPAVAGVDPLAASPFRHFPTASELRLVVDELPMSDCFAFALTCTPFRAATCEHGQVLARFGEGGTIFDAFLGLQVPTVKVMNWVFILIILVLGLGMGGWASIKTMDEKVKEFELFDRCNGC